MASAQGIDVSNYQPVQTVADFKAVQFAFMKATEGTTFTDDNFAKNWAAARAAGIVRGAYHYLSLADPAYEQAAYFLAVVRAQGLEPGDLLVVDSEVAGADADSRTVTFLDDVAAVVADTGVGLLTYTNLSVGASLRQTAAKYPDLWIAWPSGTAPASVEPWKRWQFWQWGTVSNVDRDAFNGTEADLLAWRKSLIPAPKPAAPAELGGYVVWGNPAQAKAVTSSDGGTTWS